MKTIQITFNFQKDEDINITLNTSDSGSIRLTSYSADMDFTQFCEFTDTVNELREKWWATHQNKSNS